MIAIQITAGTFGPGPGSYEFGVFGLPDGSLRGVEDLEALVLAPPERQAPRRSGIARGLREALAATGPLPNPLGLAAAVAQAGLDVLGGDARPAWSVEIRFRDGASALVLTDAETAAQIERDREVVRRAGLRLPPLGTAPSGTEAPTPEADWEGTPADAAAPDGQSLAALFAYEKRGGRVRRLSKALDGA
ncbi:hypothetical protein ASF49_21940 [Methylobacterium sp. Leaf104]|uniref:hypothetical protein n=1 Tax=Methylobacterium TaxID=407 RepID=UPI0006F6E434|nr:MULTISPECIES: hypothetical protein [Methylobacterium]KQP39095.1 hypothetical protein ASF49_21940 [Methylobacterium sp. Leaf104]MCI9881672.1 hypothetical protein [Methylobacterium goesingense]